MREWGAVLLKLNWVSEMTTEKEALSFEGNGKKCRVTIYR